MRPRHLMAVLLATGCPAMPANQTGFGSSPDLTTAPAASTGEASTSTSSASSSGSGESSDPGSASTMAEPPRDLGVMPDFGGDSPVGCKGKIDFLFVISREPNMKYRQAQLTAAFPKFIDTIQSKFDDFDYHIMVVTGDDGWGNDGCTELCPTLACKVGEPCCVWYDPAWVGKPCCDLPDYPCQELDLVTQCDRTWGAGEVFPAGFNSPNKPCPIDGDLRYLVKGQMNLEETFACIATVGSSGNTMLGQALTAAMQSNINDPGGCNKGFLRKDALLMVTLIATNPDGPAGEPLTSKGTPAEWAQALLAAKHDDEKSVVALDIGGTGECTASDRICQLTEMFPYHHHESVLVADYAPAFLEAANLVDTACAGFVPPPG